MLETIPAKELDSYTDEPGVMIIDLRLRSEYVTGHIRNAVNIPQGRFEVLPSRRLLLILYCDRGALSMAVARYLDEKGYRVKSVVGGMYAYRGNQMVKTD